MADRLQLLENSYEITQVLCKIGQWLYSTKFLLLKSERDTKQVSVVVMVSCESPRSTDLEVSKSQQLCIVNQKPPISTLIFETFLWWTNAFRTE